jgi:hypothetical protein
MQVEQPGKLVMSNEQRRDTRNRCQVRALIKVRGQTYEGWVHDVSSRGLRISTDEVAEIWTGDEVEVDIRGFGAVAGVARWRMPGRAGILLHDMLYDSTNTAAKSQALRNFISSI